MSKRLPRKEITLQYARSSGPGGQNVNKVSTKVILRWNLFESQQISEKARSRFLELFSSKVSPKTGWVVLLSDRTRSRERNTQDCLEKLANMLHQARQTPKTRKKTKPTTSSREERLKVKRFQSEKKQNRKKLAY